MRKVADELLRNCSLDNNSNGGDADKLGIDKLNAHNTTADESAVEVSEESLDEIFALATHQLNQKNFTEAKTLFQLLCYCNHFEPAYILGLGAARRALKQYDLASDTYSFASLIYPSDPRFPYYQAECQFSLENWQVAKQYYVVCLYCCEDFNEYSWYLDAAKKKIEELDRRLISE